MPKLDALLINIEQDSLTAEQFLRGPFLNFAQTIPGSPIGMIIRLLIAEGPKHPDLLQFYWDNVVSRGVAAIKGLIEKGIRAGEFKRSPVTEQPLLFVMPVVFSVIFRLLFAKQGINTDKLIDTQISLLIEHMKGSQQ